MTLIARELDQKLQSVDRETAHRLERLVRDAMDLAKATPAAGEFERLAAEESALRERLARAGRQFSAQARLSRDEVHDRDALR
jgi:DNA repair ATPase RecN